MTFLRTVLVAVLLITTAGAAHAAWHPAGNRVSFATQVSSSVGLAFGGGILVAYSGIRDSGPYDLYVHALDADGNPAPGWPAEGVVVDDGPGSQGGPVLAPAPDGGAYVAWAEYQSHPGRIKVQRLTSTGAVAAGWPQGGAVIATAYGFLFAADGSGGWFMACWVPVASGSNEQELRLMRRTADNETAAGWPTEGVSLGRAPDFHGPFVIAADGNGGVYCASTRLESRDPLTVRLVVHRYAGDGTPAANWPVNGAEMGIDDPSWRFWSTNALFPDAGGVLVVASSAIACIAGPCDQNSVALRLDTQGNRPGDWPAEGRSVAPTVNVVSDGAGGLLSAWSQTSNDVFWEPGGSMRARALRMDASGTIASGWTPEGNPLCTEHRQQEAPRIVADGSGGAFVSWVDSRTGEPVLYSSRLTSSGAIDADWQETGSLAAPEAKPIGPVMLVERPGAEPVVVWSDLRSGRIDLYAKPLTPGPAGPPAGFGEDPEGGFGFAITSVRPNPVSGSFQVMVTVPDAGEASVDLFDLSGRVIESHPLPAVSGPARGTVRFDIADRVPAGVYWVRLRQGSRSATARVVRVR